MDSRPDTYEHIAQVRRRLMDVAIELLERGHVHDASKLVEPEVSVFDEYTPKLAQSEYGSDEYKANLAGMKKGLEHHYYANRHHPEHHLYGVEDMNLIDLIEMLADWKAATERHPDGDLKKSIEMNAKRFGYDRKMENLLRYTATDLGWI